MVWSTASASEHQRPRNVYRQELLLLLLLLSTTGVAQPICTALSLEAHQLHMWEMGKGLGGWCSAAQHSCALSFLFSFPFSSCNTWESSHALPLFEGGRRWSHSSNVLLCSSRRGGLQTWGASGGGELGVKGTKYLGWEKADVGHDHSLSCVRCF